LRFSEDLGFFAEEFEVGCAPFLLAQLAALHLFADLLDAVRDGHGGDVRPYDVSAYRHLS
jgi:hypothetical protein